MATDKRIYEINLSSITQNGATCKNPTITWENLNVPMYGAGL